MVEAVAATRSRDSISNTLLVAITLSLVCSLLVAGAAVLLRPKQLQNAAEYRQSIILEVAGLANSGDPATAFAAIEPRMVELSTGNYVDSPAVEGFDAEDAARDPHLGVRIPAASDIASIRRRARYAPVYLVRSGDAIEQVILPVYGSGLWSTMYGYLSLEADGNTVRGLSFYSHAETPGLGDQVDRPAWRAKWQGKKLFGADGEFYLEVIRGTVVDISRSGASDSRYQVDGLAGATLTGRGVTNLVHYWVGPHGFGPYLAKFRENAGKQP
ncbi:MAG: Na(+)-translocating NADH-quinone reductase subunit C [Woeseiaceae bacterium]|nr:Na(+)-translocating NADH-quinone reductase subunit C [Woeseiaceae bacterium]